MDQDPNVLYTAIAQISATFVSILGGFLLTYGLRRAAQKRKYEEKSSLWNSLMDEFQELQETLDRQIEAHTKERDRTFADIFARAWRGQIDDDEANRLRRNAIQKLDSDIEEFERLIQESKDRLRQAKQESRELSVLIGVELIQFRIAGVGLLLLVLLGLVGVGIPLFILPASQSQEWNLLGWIAHRGSILLLLFLMIYVFSVFILAEGHRYYRTRGDQLADLSWTIAFALLLLWPSQYDHWSRRPLVWLFLVMPAWKTLHMILIATKIRSGRNEM